MRTFTLTRSLSPTPIALTAAPTAVKALASDPRVLKAVSNLKADPSFTLPKRETYQNALYFYNNKFKGGVKYPELVWMSLLTQVLFPSLQQKPTKPFIRNKFKDVLDMISEGWTASGAVALTTLKKDSENQRFMVSVPVLGLPLTSNVPHVLLAAWVMSGEINFNGSPEYQEYLNKASQFAEGTHKFSLQNIHAGGNISEDFVSWAKKLDVKLVIRTTAAKVYVMIELPFSRRECEYMCNTEWLTVRPLDMYGMIKAWVDGYYGRRSRSPTSTIPLADIAKSVEGKNAKPRLSKEGLLVNEDGEFYALPAKLNSIYQYEDATAAAMSHEDDTFSLMAPDNTHAKLMHSTPVFIDWVNLKFAYTSTEGRLLIMNLDRSQPLNVTHARKFLESKIESDNTMNFLSMALKLAKFTTVLDEEPGLFLKAMVAEIDSQGFDREGYQDASEIPLVSIYEYGQHAGTRDDGTPVEPAPMCAKFVSVMTAMQKFLVANPTNAYATYSVTTVCRIIAQTKIFLEFGSRYPDVITEDNSKRSAYENQEVSDDYKLPAVPLIGEGKGLMPHQVKVQNLLKDRPDNAILPVDAGGGKTSLVVYEVLREIAEDDGKQGLCLVLCPSHLVAQYVKEFTYFTEARVNVVPVTSYTIRRQGFKRLEAMLQHAPRNTVVVSDYNAILLGNSSIAYGSSVVKTFPVIEFLRQFHYKYVACDESHWLKNGSSRNAAVARLIIEIQKKRLASGTFLADTIVDLVRQTSLMDPTVFGTQEDFINKYALETRGGKVTRWKDGAELAIKRHLGQHVVIAEAKRKEWAAILPQPIPKFHPAELTPKQQEVYHTILEQVIQLIMEKAKENKVLREILEGKSDPDEMGDALDAMLKPYLARLERFITAPGKDIYGATVLTGEDAISPKIAIINQICKDHIEQGLEGKILIFTNYKLSTDAIYEGLAMVGLQDQTIYYTAGTKEECGAEFEKNPNKKILVGIEQSLNTGLNLQFCSRLIRVETVWTPGALEQGNSRIGRPNVKAVETRTNIYYDTIVANRTIDVTKVSYLMTKTINKAKFDEAGNPRFDELESPPLLKMTLDTIQAESDWNETMVEYFSKYEAFVQAQAAEFAEYREANKTRLLTADGKLKMEKLVRASNPNGSALMLRVPYVPGTELYKSEDLGLMRYDDFVDKFRDASDDDEEEEDMVDEEGEGEEDDNESEKDLTDEKKAALAREREMCTGMGVHTDYGDGEIKRVNVRTLTVQLPSGEKIKVRKLSAFVITRANTSNKDLRNQLLKMTGDVPLDKPIDVLEVKIKPEIEEANRKSVDKQKKDSLAKSKISLNLSFTVANDYLGVRLDNIDDERAVKVAQGAGFKFTPDYFAAEIKNPNRMLNFFRILKDKGFSLDKECNDRCADAYLHYKANRSMPNLFFGFAKANEIKNFFRREFKPKPDKEYVQPYPLIQDGKLYLCLPKQGHPGSVNAIRKTVATGLKWMVYDAESEMINFVGTKPAATALIQQLLAQGVEIGNIEELKESFRSLKMAKLKSE